MSLVEYLKLILFDSFRATWNTLGVRIMFSVGFGVLVTGINSILSATPKSGVLSWLVAALLASALGFGLFFIIQLLFVTPYQVWKQNRETILSLRAEEERTQALYKNREVKFETLSVEKSFVSRGSRVGQGLVKQLRITNDPLLYGGMVFRAPVTVVAEISYTGVTSNTLKIEGRWGDSPLPRGPDDMVSAITIMPGESRVLDVAVRFGQDWYALDNRSPFEGYQVSNYRLLGNPVRIDVRLKGDIDVTRRYELRESGEMVAV
jgi:hypothetical protein